MKKLIVMTVAVASLVAMQAKATVTVEISAESLYDQFGAGHPISLVTEVLMVVDTTGAGMPSGPLTPFSIGGNADGTPMALATIPGFANDVIVWKGTAGETTGVNGQIDFVATIALSGGVAAGQKVGLLWLTLPAANSTVAGATQYYGTLSAAANVLPADGGAAGYDFADTADSGTDTILSHTAGPGVSGTNLIIPAVPEPSSVLLVVTGLLGLLGLRRRS